MWHVVRVLSLVLGACLSFPLIAAETQLESKVPRIGYLSLAPGPSPRSEALREGLRQLGYVENQNIAMEYRWADGNVDRLAEGATELVRSHVDVIVTGGPAATLAAKKASAAVPIVMAVDYDPVAVGFVGSLARPGGNITGLSVINPELSGKRLELLREFVPRIARVAVLWNPAEPNARTYLRETQVAASTMGMKVLPFEVKGPGDVETDLQAARKADSSALIVLTDFVTLYNRTALAELAAKYHLPAIYSERLFVEAGGLMSYGASDLESHHRAAVYVDKILRGAKPADLPVEQPTKFELVINVKAAKALGLTTPQSLLMRADEVIQ
jgi:putative ABC transport system substrate-binding protein